MQIKKLDVDRCIAVINASDACEINLEHWNVKAMVGDDLNQHHMPARLASTRGNLT